MITTLLMLSALAQEREEPEVPDVDVQEFRQSLDAESTLWTNDASMRPSKYFIVRTGFGYMRDPFVFQYEDDEVVSVVGDAVQANVAGTFHFWRMRLGVDVPIYLFTSSDVTQGNAGVGDLLLDLKGTILDHHKSGFGLALAARTTLPTSTMSLPLGGSSVGYEVEAILDGVAGPVLVAFNLGHRGVGKTEFGDRTWRDRLYARLGVGVMDRDQGGFSVDIGMSTPYDGLFTALATPVEGMAGGWARLGEDVVLRAGVGTGFTGAIGSPMVRGLLSLSWEPRWRDFPETSAPVAPVTNRQLPPGQEVATDPGGLVVRVTDQDGTPLNGWARVTHITVPPGVERPDKPTELEVVGGTAKGQLPPGRVQVKVSSDGYADAYIEGVVVSGDGVSFSVPLAIQKAVLYEDRIEILEQVFFEPGSTTIKEESYELLDQVATILKATPEVVRMRIEGHTDSRGDDDSNLLLSSDRADAVMDYLVSQGVGSARLKAVGMGERDPIDPRETEEAWELNRRVEFIVEEWDGSISP